MKLVHKEESKMKVTGVQVAVRIVGEGLEGKMKGKTVYQMFESVDVSGAPPDQVWSVVLRALETAERNDGAQSQRKQ